MSKEEVMNEEDEYSCESCGYDEIHREIQGIGIKNYNPFNFCGDHMISLNTPFPDRDVEFPLSEKEELIITYKDKCGECGEYVGESYNIVYKYESIHFGLNSGEYNGRIHSFRILDTKEIDEVGLDPTLQYIYLELSGYTKPFNNLEKIYIQKDGWDKINKSFIKANGRALKIGDPLFELVIDKQNRVIKYSYIIPKSSIEEVKEDE